MNVALLIRMIDLDTEVNIVPNISLEMGTYMRLLFRQGRHKREKILCLLHLLNTRKLQRPRQTQ
jgi:hypothetical protein